jgi:hypothetical protein
VGLGLAHDPALPPLRISEKGGAVKHVTKAPIVEVPIADVIVGQRRREKLGRIKSLAVSIQINGLVHPILLRGMTLVAGHRRLEACRSLNWKTIPARQVERLTDEQLRAIELDENTVREGLSDFATSKARLAQIRQAEADLKAKAAEAVSVHPVNKNSKRDRAEGRPKGRTAGSKRDVANVTGISPANQEKIERHVKLAEAYPFMQRPGWLRHRVLDAGDQLDKIPPKHRSEIAALLDQDAIPPKTAVEILGNVATMSDADRKQIVDLAHSSDSHERQKALTMAAAVPPPVDPGLLLLGDAEDKLSRAAKACRSPVFKPQLITLADQASTLLQAFREANHHDRRASLSESPKTSTTSKTA